MVWDSDVLEISTDESWEKLSIRPRNKIFPVRHVLRLTILNLTLEQSLLRENVYLVLSHPSTWQVFEKNILFVITFNSFDNFQLQKILIFYIYFFLVKMKLFKIFIYYIIFSIFWNYFYNYPILSHEK